jgi:hypothetical protein
MDNNILSALKAIDVATLSRADWICGRHGVKGGGLPLLHMGRLVPERQTLSSRRVRKASGTAFTAPALPSRAALSSRWRRNAAGLPSAAKTDASIGMTPSNMTVLTVSTDSRLPTRGALPQTSSPTSNCSLTQTTASAMSRMMCGRTPKASGCRARACTIAPPGNSSQSLKKHPDDLGATIGDWKPQVGAWIRFNPLDGDGVKNENITKFRFALVESDTLPVAEQDIVFRKLELPIAALVHSRGKSLHAIVRVDAENYDEYRKRVEFLYDFLEKNGVSPSTNRTAIRPASPVCRESPGTATASTLLRPISAGSHGWTGWISWKASRTNCPTWYRLDTFKDNPPELPEELITGILRRGHKMLISGSSKAGKSFLLMELCIAIAEGKPWLGFPCKKGRVLYVNLEIDPASAINRFLKIYEALGLPIKNCGQHRGVEPQRSRRTARPACSETHPPCTGSAL